MSFLIASHLETHLGPDQDSSTLQCRSGTLLLTNISYTHCNRQTLHAPFHYCCLVLHLFTVCIDILFYLVFYVGSLFFLFVKIKKYWHYLKILSFWLLPLSHIWSRWIHVKIKTHYCVKVSVSLYFRLNNEQLYS